MSPRHSPLKMASSGSPGVAPFLLVVKNAQHALIAKVEGDRWYHTGKLAGGMTIEEVWERVKPTETHSIAIIRGAAD